MKCSLLVLSSYLDGELEARREGELEAHLVGCQRCRAGLGYLREEVERVGALGRVQVADHSVHALLTQLGLVDEDEPVVERGAPVALAQPPEEEGWIARSARREEVAMRMPWSPAHPHVFEPSVDMTGTPQRGGLPTVDSEYAEYAEDEAGEEQGAEAFEEEISASAEQPVFRWVDESGGEQPQEQPPAPRPPFTWAPVEEPPAPHAGPSEGPHIGADAGAEPEGVPAVPFAFTPPSLTPPESPPHGPPPAPEASDEAPSAPPSGGAFPPGGPERVEPSDLPAHDNASGGEPEMTASPPWAPHEAPTGPLYPLTDDDVLGEPVPVERFGPPPQAARPSLFERLRDRIAVRRALSRSSSAYDDQVQIVSGLGAPLRPGRARAEVERRRQETLRMDPGGIPVPGEAVPPYGSARLDAGLHSPLPPSSAPRVPTHDDLDADHELGFDDYDAHIDPNEDNPLGLGPVPTPLSPQTSPMPRPPLPPRSGVLSGQMPLPGTVPASSASDPFSPTSGDPRAPIHRTPMPPPRHTLGGTLGELPPPGVPLPPAAPPPPVPDPLGEALSGFDRDRGTVYESRPWRPRELAEDVQAPQPPRYATAPPDTAERHRPSPSQLRDGRRLLAVFGAATLVMFVVGMVSGRSTSPVPTSSSQSSNTAPVPATHPSAKASQPAARSSAPAQAKIGPAVQPSQAPAAGTPQLTSVKVLGDGGTGYQVKDFRYGIHPNDFRIVLDMDSAGTASGTPKATIGFLDPTTLYVVLDGVVPAGSTGQLPSSDPVTSVSLVQPSPFPGATTYQLKLAHPVQFSSIYASGPLRLVIDLAG